MRLKGGTVRLGLIVFSDRPAQPLPPLGMCALRGRAAMSDEPSLPYAFAMPVSVAPPVALFTPPQVHLQGPLVVWPHSSMLAPRTTVIVAQFISVVVSGAE